MIKTKLEEGKDQSKKLKTDINIKEEPSAFKTQKKMAELNLLLAKTVKPKKQNKRKKLELTITNTKCDLIPRRNQEKMK
jgi:hypothetical protein